MNQKLLSSLLIVLVGCCFTSLCAQSSPTSAYLSSFRSSSALRTFDAYSGKVNDLNFSLPGVDEINLRTETDQFNLSRQEYALRVMFNNWGAGKSYKSEKAWLMAKIEADKGLYGAELLLSKYFDLVDLYHHIQKTEAYIQDSIFADSMIRATVNNILADQSNDVDDLLNWEERKFVAHQKLQEEKSSASLLQSYTGFTSFDWSNWPDVTFMKSVLEQYSFEGLSPSVSKAFEADSMLLEDRWAVSRKNDHRLLDYAQLRYSRRDNLLFQDEFSIGLGFRLPYKGTQKKQSNDYRIELLDLQQEKAIELAEKESAINDAMKKFNLLLIQWNALISTESLPASVNLSNPEVSRLYEIEKRKRGIENNAKKLDLKKKITEQYLQTLYLQGEMEKSPCVNYLSTLLPVF